jgi:hypothetical protein
MRRELKREGGWDSKGAIEENCVAEGKKETATLRVAAL